MAEKLLKVIYLNSDNLDIGYRTELNIEGEQLVAIEIYSSGKFKVVVLKEGYVEYLQGLAKE